MSRLYEQFIELLKIKTGDDSINVIPVRENLSHKLGCSNDGYPMFFIACGDEQNDDDISLDLFKVSFNTLCKLYDVSSRCHVDKKYTIIYLKSTTPDLQEYFLDVVSLVLDKLPSRPTSESVKREITKVISLFIASPIVSEDIIQGLWAELFVIYKAADPLYLINSWHTKKTDIFDFNDGIDKLEVKSTSGSVRKHGFSLEQLRPNDNSELLIASLFVSRSGLGNSIRDLLDFIIARIPMASEEILKLKEQVIRTIGVKDSTPYNITFDFKRAEDYFKLYDYHDIPSICGDIPKEVTKVHFQSNLSDVPSIFEKDYVTTSKLFTSLWERKETIQEAAQ